MSVEVPYYENLVEIRKLAEQTLNGYPKKYCTFMSNFLKLTQGLECVSGYFEMGEERESHSWNRDSHRGLIVDLTVDQFDLNLPRVGVFSSDDSRLVIDSFLTGAQRNFSSQIFLILCRAFIRL